MAIGVSLLAQLHSTTNADDYTTPSFNIPSGDVLLVAIVHGRGTITADPTVDDSGAGLSWTLPGADPSAIGARYVGHFVAKSTAPATGVTLSAHFLTADTPNGCALHVLAITGADLSGSAAAAIIQNYAAEWSSATSHEITLGAAVLPSSGLIISSQIASQQTMTAPADFTELAQGGFNSPATTSQTAWKTGHSSAFVQGASWPTGTNGGFTVIEVKEAAGGVSGSGSISQASTVAATGRKASSRVATISQAIAIAATARKAASGAGAILQASTITAPGRKGGRGAGVVTHSTSTTATGREGGLAQPTIVQGTAATATGRKAASGVATIGSVTGITASGVASAAAVAAISQASTVVATGRKATSGAAAISTSSAAVATGREGGLAAPTIILATGITATARKAVGGVGTVAQGSTVTASGTKAGGTPNLSGSGAITQASLAAATGRKGGIAPAIAVSQGSSVAASGQEGARQLAAISQAVVVAATGRKGATGVAAFSTATSVVASASGARRGTATLLVGSTLTATAREVAFGAGAIVTVSGVTAAGRRSDRLTTIGLLEAIMRTLEPPPSLGPYGLVLTISGVVVDDSFAEPFDYKVNRLYLWLEDESSYAASPDVLRQDFYVRAVFMGNARDEEPKLRKRRDVSAELEAKRSAYLAAVEDAQHTSEWEYAAASVDWDFTRNFEGRGFAVDIRGYRHIV